MPCAIVHSGERILVLERSERSGKKKHPLHGKLVLWAGGHVRIEDALTGTFDVWLEALEREIEEELDLPRLERRRSKPLSGTVGRFTSEWSLTYLP